MDFFIQKNKLLECYQALIDDKGKLISEDDIEVFKERKNDFKSEQFHIVVAGRFSSGKSSLINSTFLKDDILPYKNKPTTCHPVYIRYGEERRLVLRDKNGHTEVIAGDDTETIKSALTNYVTLYGDDPDRYQLIELYWPDSDLLKNGVVLVDTIGTEDTEEKYIQQTFKEMERASAVIFLTSVQQAGTETEKNLIEKYLSNTGKKLFIIMTQADTLEPDEQEEVRENFCRRFESFFLEKKVRVEERVYLTSAKTGQGLAELRKNLAEFIANDSLKELLQQHGKQLENNLQVIKQKTENDLHNYQIKKSGDEKKLHDILEKITKLNNDFINNESENIDLKQELKDSAKYDLENDVMNLKNKFIRETKSASGDDLNLMAQDIVYDLESLGNKIGRQVQLDVQKQTKERVNRWSRVIDFDILDEHISFIDNLKLTSLTKNWDTAGKCSGMSAIVMGIHQATTVGVATAQAGSAAITQTGLISSAWASLFGAAANTTAATAVTAGTATTVTAAASVAAPWVIAGVAGIWAGKQLSMYLGKNIEKNNKEKTTEKIKIIFNRFGKEYQKIMDNYIDHEVDKQFSSMQRNIENEQNNLSKIINENDINKLQNQIDTEKIKLESLDQFIYQVEQCH